MPVPDCLSLTIEVLRLGSIVVQVLHLLAVALSHYLGSLRPFQYHTTATPAALRLTLAVVWIVPSECSYILLQEFVSSILDLSSLLMINSGPYLPLLIPEGGGGRLLSILSS